MKFDYHGIHGFDVSTYQDSPDISGHVDYQKMKSWGARFIIIRAGIGISVDSDFAINWKNAKGVLPRASYWAYKNDQTPKAQAYKYRDVIEPDFEGVYIWDLEDRSSNFFGMWKAWYDCLETFKLITGLPSSRIWIYTNLFYFEEFTMSATDEQRLYFKQYPLFLAAYTQDWAKPNYLNIQLPRPFTSCIMLQSGTPAIGLQVGVESKEIDYDQFNGDETEFAKYFQVIDPEPIPEPEEPAMFYGKIKTLTNIRNTPPGGSYNDIGDLLPGDLVVADRKETINNVEWWHLISASHNGQPVITLGGLNVEQRADCWAYGVNIESVLPPPPVIKEIDRAVIYYKDGSFEELIVKP